MPIYLLFLSAIIISSSHHHILPFLPFWQYIQFQYQMSCPQQAEFSFQYHIDLGNNKISPILITHLSDPYIEASKFCAKEGLPSILVTVLGDAMRDQMLHEKGLVQARKKGTTEGKASLGKTDVVMSDTLNTQLKEESGGSLSIWLHQDPSKILPVPPAKRERPPLAERGNVFESLYNNYREIEKKKQLSRKKSFQAIPFRPSINHLSEKIVLNKRRVEQEMNTLPMHTPLDGSSSNQKRYPNGSSSSKTKLTYTVSAFHHNNTNDSRGSSRENLYERSSSYLKRSQQKRKRLRESIQRKLMQGCSFRPKINNRIR